MAFPGRPRLSVGSQHGIGENAESNTLTGVWSLARKVWDRWGSRRNRHRVDVVVAPSGGGASDSDFAQTVGDRFETRREDGLVLGYAGEELGKSWARKMESCWSVTWMCWGQTLG
jgi:hypothetical protein